jgi:general secretion pathway protein B
MSYLLEALKKSDKERQRGTIPDLQTDHSRPSGRRERQRTTSWRFPGIVVFVLLCGGLFWMQYGRQDSNTKESVPESGVLVAKEEVAVPVVVVVKKAPAKTVVVVKEQPNVEETNKVIPVADIAFVPPLLDELPVAVRAAIPDLSFAGHVYSDVPQKRLIIINNRIVREGDLIVNGLTLEEIESDGVVLRYESSIFRVELF